MVLKQSSKINIMVGLYSTQCSIIKDRTEKETKKMKGRKHSKNPSISVCISQECEQLLAICHFPI